MKNFFLKIYYFLRSIKNLILVGINILFALSIISNEVNPNSCVYVAPFGFMYFFLYIFHIVIFFLYFKRRKRIAIPALILLLIGSIYIRNTINVTFQNDKKGIKVMTWNVKNFDLYNWTNNLNTRKEIFKLIKEESPDILAIQEFYTNSSNFDNIGALKNLGYPYIYFQPTFSQSDHDQWGLAIVSKFPLKQKELLPEVNQKTKMNRTIKATATTPSGEIDIYTSHFQSIHLHYDDYNYIDKLKNDFHDYNSDKTYTIFQKIIIAYEYRVKQIETLVEDIHKNNHKAIVCCDLNDIPNSYSYHLLSKNLVDSYRKKGNGFSNTVSIVLPLLRIDYIFTTDNLMINGYQKINTNLSDHNIIISYIQ